MPALNFMKQFAPAVKCGEKRMTFRKPRKDGRDPKPGDTLYLYTGMRTKQCELLATAACIEVAPAEFTKKGAPIIGEEVPTPDKREYIAALDGHDSYADMIEFFKSTHGLPFVCNAIFWE